MSSPKSKYPSGWMADDCMGWLREQGAKVEKMAVEIGSYRGRSATALLERMRPGAILMCVDNWTGADGDPDQQRGYDAEDSVYKEFMHHMLGPISDGRLHPYRMDSLQAAKDISGLYGQDCLDFCFIDGDHRYEGVKADILAYLPLMRHGGVIAGHDFATNRWLGVKQAVEEVFGTDFTRGPGSIWIARAG